MKIAYFSNFLNHHQFPVAKHLSSLSGGNYVFIEDYEIPDEYKCNGYPSYDGTPWLIQAWKSEELRQKAYEKFIEADIAIFGGAYPYKWIKERLELNRITFEYGERWLKRGLINVFSPRLLKNQWYHHLHFRNRPLYRLNSGAYASSDMHLLHAFKGKRFKWGYFTDSPDLEEAINRRTQHTEAFRIIWCARFIKLKHPEIPVLLAEKLKSQGLKFKLDMYGSGPLSDKTKKLIASKDLENEVILKGTLPNENLMDEFFKSNLFLLTSDRHEGWGAVINEAMSRGCPVVTSKEVGAAPWLIEEGINGFTFHCHDIESLTDKVASLIKNKENTKKMGLAAYHKIHSEWSPENAAKRFIQLCEALKSGKPTPFTSGPCSED